MRFSLIAILASASAAMAVDISNAPACAQTCLKENESASKCDSNSSDVSCFCADKDYYNVVAKCVLSSCSASDAEATRTWYQNQCNA